MPRSLVEKYQEIRRTCRIHFRLRRHTRIRVYIYIYIYIYTGLFEMIVGVLTTCHTQYT